MPIEYYVYVLKSQKLNRFYIGQTKKLSTRLKEHNSGKVRSTKYYSPWNLISYEVYNTRTEARKRENYLKSLKSKNYILKEINKKITDAG